ncbi:MAG TPA: lysylphosphatidylglycerol synthase transmembrane domain-containing protein [Gaiellaceae bacterium]|nr:lysylphosphatidylglycerol synthase transmembrane domain-containing protein [Gaiellaceae bacterium]
MKVLRWWRVAVPIVLLGVAISLIWWRGPDWGTVHDSFTVVRWPWVAAAVGLNLASVFVRSLAWNTTIKQAMPEPYPGYRLVFAAFAVGLFGNVVLPGRVGELARVAVLTRRMPGRRGLWATLVGTVFAHRVFDLFPVIALIVWVLLAAKLPDWAGPSLIVALCVGLVLFVFAWMSARRHQTQHVEGVGTVRTMLTRVRFGLGVMREPIPALTAGTFQFLGWLAQLAAVWAAMRAFHIYQPFAAAGLVLVLMNVATIFPLWPGNVGLVQAAIALPLKQYGVDYAHGFAFGIGLQAIEASVGVGIGVVFLAREGISYAMLKEIPNATEDDHEPPVGPSGELPSAPARVSG